LWEHLSTPSSLCTLTYDIKEHFSVEFNIWELHQAAAIPDSLNDIGEKGRQSLRDLKINVTTAQEAHNLQYLRQLQELRMLIMWIPHDIFVCADGARWRGLVSLSWLRHLKLILSHVARDVSTATLVVILHGRKYTVNGPEELIEVQPTSDK